MGDFMCDSKAEGLSEVRPLSVFDLEYCACGLRCTDRLSVHQDVKT